jgi:hypothetical protein
MPDFKNSFIDLNNFAEHKFHIADIKERIKDIPKLALLFEDDKYIDDNLDVMEENCLLKSELKEFKIKIAGIEKINDVRDVTDDNERPKTALATEAAQTKRVEEWKNYAVVMAKIAYDCGREDRKQVTRSEYKQMAKRHGALSGQALELLRNALPEGVTQKTGGPASQG